MRHVQSTEVDRGEAAAAEDRKGFPGKVTWELALKNEEEKVRAFHTKILEEMMGSKGLRNC